VKRSHGGVSKRSRNLRVSKQSVSKLLAEFKAGAAVRLCFNPAFLKGRPNSLRFNNRVGIIAGKRGKAFEVEFSDGGKKKTLVVANVHLQKA